MGGDNWTTTGPYQQNIAAAFRQAQEQELANGIHDHTGRTIDELWEDPDWREYIFTGGTGSTLDFFELLTGGGHENEPGKMRLLTDAEVKAWAPDGKPTYGDWRIALKDSDLFGDLDRACGNCTVLYRNGQPTEIGYWGITAD